MNTEITQEKQDKLDYAYIEKLEKKSERQLTKILNTLDKEIIKITIEKEKIESKLNEKIKKKAFCKRCFNGKMANTEQRTFRSY